MRLIEKGVDEYVVTCTECGARFAYTRADVHTNYVRGGEEVSCPHCGHHHRHHGMGKWERTGSCRTGS